MTPYLRLFRDRADRPNGTASDYASGAQADIPVTDPTPPASDPNMTLDPPSVHVTGHSDGISQSVYVNLNVSTPYNSDDYKVFSAGDATRTDDPLHVLPGAGVLDEGSGVGASGVLLGECSQGATYTFNMATYLYSDDPTDTQYSPPVPAQVAVPGTLAPKLSLEAESPEGPGPVDFTWDPPANETGPVTFYEVKTVDGKDSAVQVGSGNVEDGDAELNLPAGEDKVFAVYDGWNSEEVDYSYSPYSNQVQVKVEGWAIMPAGIVGATVVNSSGQDEIQLHWTNSSNNETGYVVMRTEVDGTSNEATHSEGGGATTVATTSPDTTSVVDTNVTPGKHYFYTVEPQNGPPHFQGPRPTTEVSATQPIPVIHDVTTDSVDRHSAIVNILLYDKRTNKPLKSGADLRYKVRLQIGCSSFNL